MKIRALMALCVVALESVSWALQEAPVPPTSGSCSASRSLNAASPSVEIKSEGGRWEKDVKQIKFSVDGGDVEVTQAVLHWDNRPDDTISVGTLKSGGESAPAEAPMRKGRLKGVTLQYKVIGDAPATIKVWGYD